MHSSTPRASCVITSKDGQHTIVEDGQRTIVSGRPAGARGLEEPEYSGRRAARSISIGLEEPMEMETMEVAALRAGRPQKALITGNRTGSQEHWEPGALGAGRPADAGGGGRPEHEACACRLDDRPVHWPHHRGRRKPARIKHKVRG
jgi:hypothetical protein